ncbi:MAG TPA: S41 family peptidase [Bacteroidota bacterium]|nr:S41 family peptidase [Bacteroidota bacterium]
MTKTGLIVLFAVLSGFTWQGDDLFYQINKGIDVYGRVYREVSLNYVDGIDPMELMESGVDGMLSSLDPYTNFINDDEGDEVDLITSGKYGGIGVTVGTRDGHITIMTVMDGYSAERQGLLPGDRILKIDDKPLSDLKPSEVRVLTRGAPGTEVRVQIERDGVPAPLEFVLVREEIRLKNVSYAGMIGDGVAYIRLERFSRDAGDEIALALKDFRLRGPVKGVVLDLRNNPGGLLDAAVDVVEKFVPRGSLIVSTRGRKPESERKYFSGADPLIPDLPLVVIVNNNSASASEIVAAAVQDLDRGIILGTRSFGKGLVQTVVPLVYNTQLKITTAKYYTPSGRCLQEISYARGGVKDTSGRNQSFRTLKGRNEYGSGGVAPDTVVGEASHSPLYASLIRRSMFFRFATAYRRDHPGESAGVSAGGAATPDLLLGKFREFLADQKFRYEDDAVNHLDESIDLVRKTEGDSGVVADLVRIRGQLVDRMENTLGDHANEILSAISVELRGLEGGEGARIAATLGGDPQVKAGADLIRDIREYEKRLSYGMSRER